MRMRKSQILRDSRAKLVALDRRPRVSPEPRGTLGYTALRQDPGNADGLTGLLHLEDG